MRLPLPLLHQQPLLFSCQSVCISGFICTCTYICVCVCCHGCMLLNSSALLYNGKHSLALSASSVAIVCICWARYIVVGAPYNIYSIIVVIVIVLGASFCYADTVRLLALVTLTALPTELAYLYTAICICFFVCMCMRQQRADPHLIVGIHLMALLLDFLPHCTSGVYFIHIFSQKFPLFMQRRTCTQQYTCIHAHYK